MKKLGVITMVLGAILTVLTSLKFSFNKDENDSEAGNFQITNQERFVSWSPVIGVSIMIVGAGAYMLGVKKSLMEKGLPPPTTYSKSEF